MKRLKIFMRMVTIILCCGGTLLFGLSLFAVQIGIDNDTGWGKGRIILLLLGMLCFLIALLIRFSARFTKIWHSFQHFSQTIKLMLFRQSWFHRISQFFSRLKVIICSIPGVSKFQQSPALQRYSAAILGILLVFITYNGVIRSDRISFRSSNYYDQLADGFLAGQTSLLEKPPQALTGLADPYDWRSREGIDYLWDATLYQGSYYLYWGAVPALVAAVVKLIHPMILLDQWLVWSFCIGTSILFALLLCFIHKQLFPTVSVWIILPFSWLGGVATPILWLTTRPSVYEAAIAGGQFFLLLGLYAALKALWQRTASSAWLLLAGFAWGAAINCRINLSVAVAWFCLCLAILLYRKQGKIFWLQQMLMLAIPLLLWGGALGAYNAARFGSIFETGHRYQLDGPAMPTEYGQVLSWHYILPSLYSYLIRPVQIEWHSFPFLSAPYVTESMWPFFIRLPKYYYYPEPTAGILITTPAVWLAFLPLLDILRRLKNWLLEKPQSPAIPYPKTIRQFWWIIAGAGCLTFLVLLLFNVTSLRYLADVMPILLLLAISGLWWAILRLQTKQKGYQFLSFLAWLLILCSGISSILINLSHQA
jgi:hypothetical protein